MSELHRGDPLQVSIETATIDGSGVARVDGQVVFVPGALPGERCSVRIAHVGRSAVFAQLLSVLTPSAHRVEPDCPYFPRCGGCALRHMDYAEELSLKLQRVNDALHRIGKLCKRDIRFRHIPSSAIVEPSFLLYFILFEIHNQIIVTRLPLHIFCRRIFFVKSSFGFGTHITGNRFVIIIVTTLEQAQR